MPTSSRSRSSAGDDADVRLGTASVRLARRGLAPGAALLAIRPAAVLLSASPADGVLEGEVLKASYLGSHVEYEVDTSYGRTVRNRRPCQPDWKPATHVGIRFADRGVALTRGR